MRLLNLILAWLHLISAFTLVGGSIFVGFVLAPAAKAQSGNWIVTLAATEKRYRKLARRMVEVVILTGVANLLLHRLAFHMPWTGHYLGTIALKLALVLTMVFLYARRVKILTALADKGTLGEVENNELKRADQLIGWQMVLGAVVILLGLSLRG